MNVPNRRLLYVISYHHACNDGTLMALVALLPILVHEMSLSYSEVGLLGFGLVITVVVQLLVGRVADRLSSRYLLEVGAALMAISFIMVLFVNDFAGLFLAVIAMRVGASFYHPVGISWITKEYAGPHLESALGVQSGIGNLGVILAFATSGFLGEGFGWKVPCALWAFLNIVAIVLGFAVVSRLPPRPKETVRKAAPDPKDTLIRMAALTVPIAGGGALYQVTSYFGPINLTTMHGWTAGAADLVFAFWIGVGTVTSYYYGRLSAMYGRKAMLTAGYLISTVAALLLFFVSDWYLVVPLVMAFGAVLFVTYPALFSMITDVTDTGERGTAFGILFGFQLGGGAVVVYLCGIVADIADNPAYSFLLVGLLGLASLAIVSSERIRAGPRAVPTGASAPSASSGDAAWATAQRSSRKEDLRPPS